MLRTLLATALLAFAPMVAQAAPEIGKQAPDFTGTDAAGEKVRLRDLKGNIVVLEWNNPGCPFVKKHYGSGNMQELQAYAAKQGVTWLTINSSAEGKQGNLTPVEATEFVAEQKAKVNNYILDYDGSIGKLYGAKTTPHMFVIDKNGALAYSGAIDDKTSPDPETVKSAHNYVKAAIDSLVAGKKVDVATTQPYGCFVKYAD
jgi:peroxiredoxin